MVLSLPKAVMLDHFQTLAQSAISVLKLPYVTVLSEIMALKSTFSWSRTPGLNSTKCLKTGFNKFLVLVPPQSPFLWGPLLKLAALEIYQQVLL